MIHRRVLVDTHALLWWQAKHRKLSRTARTALERADAVLVSAVTCWEILTLVGAGRIRFDRSVTEWFADLEGDDRLELIDADLVESTCLSHDLGHPPFGHAGERTLHKLMEPYGGFEGNAQTLRILTQTLFSEGRNGMNPTRALLDGVLKYKTLFAEKPANKANHYLYNDQERWLDFTMGGQAFPIELTPGKTRNGFKSIECQIMDWADDTAYSLNDIADGIHAGFVNVQRLERWAEEQTLSEDDKADVAFLCKAMRENRVEGRLNRLIGECIRATTLVPTANFLSQSTRRHQFTLEIDPVQRRRADLHKKIALDLVFRSPQLQQLDHKADFILTRLFEVLRDRYIEAVQPKGLHLMPAAIEKEIQTGADASIRARLVCDWIANMTDHFAFRTYRRLFDADFGSITDFV